MTRLLKWLSVLLVVQSGLAISLWAVDRPVGAPDRAEGPLLSFDPRNVEVVEITGTGDNRVTLERQENGWALASANGFTASETRVTQLLETLSGLEAPSVPTATSEGARARFRVADDDFQRRVELTLESGDTQTLYVGESAGRNRSQVRVAAEDAIWDVELATFEVPDEASAWRDKTVLQIAPDAVESVVVNGEKRPNAEVDPILDALGSWQFDTLLGEEERPEYGLSDPLHTIQLMMSESEGITLAIGERTDTDNARYVVKRSDRAEYFGFRPDSIQPLLSAL